MAAFRAARGLRAKFGFRFCRHREFRDVLVRALGAEPAPAAHARPRAPQGRAKQQDVEAESVFIWTDTVKAQTDGRF